MRDHGLSVESADVLAAVVSGPDAHPGHPGPAWTPRTDLEQLHGAEVVAGLLEGGWLVVWDGVTGGPLVTLTPLAAFRLEVELDEFDADETPGWVASGRADHPVRVAPLRYQVPLPYPDRVVDPASVREAALLTFDEADASDYAVRAEAGQLVTLWGMPVPIDPRVKGKRAG